MTRYEQAYKQDGLLGLKKMVSDNRKACIDTYMLYAGENASEDTINGILFAYSAMENAISDRLGIERGWLDEYNVAHSN